VRYFVFDEFEEKFGEDRESERKINLELFGD
jgi:hypothetical protein